MRMVQLEIARFCEILYEIQCYISRVQNWILTNNILTKDEVQIPTIITRFDDMFKE